MYDDWTVILILPGLLLGLWARYRVQSAYKKYRKITTRQGVPAKQVACDILDRSGNGGVSVRPAGGRLTDHYDPRHNTLNLSNEVFGSADIAAVGIAAHECGHAMQQGSGYGPLKIRSAVVPVVNIGTHLYFPVFMLGIVLSWQPLVTIGILCFALTLVFSLISLPVEFDASRRALSALSEGGYVTEEELRGVRKVLGAAALTYVAAAISSLLQLLRLLIIARRRD